MSGRTLSLEWLESHIALIVFKNKIKSPVNNRFPMRKQMIKNRFF
jgi:hypothetical protein